MMISIIIPLYNKADSIKDTIKSIQRQTYSNYEIIVVDDGSTDNSYNVVSKIKEPRLRIVRQLNQGVSAARNRGVKEANADFVAFLDADDEWKEDYLYEQVKLIETFSDCGIFACGYEYKNETGAIVPTVIRGLKFNTNHGILENYFEVASISAPPVWTSAVIVKRECFIKVGGFKVGVYTGEDLLLWAKLASEFKIAYNKANLAYYNLPSTGTLRKDPRDMSLKGDVVRYELMQLYKAKNPYKINLYLSFWDKMRAVINIRKGESIEAIKYSINSIRWNFKNTKAYMTLFLSLLPSKMAKSLLKR